MVTLILALFVGTGGGAEPQVRIKAAKNPRIVEVQADLSDGAVQRLPAGRLTPEQGEALLQFSLLDVKAGKTGPAIFGNYKRVGRTLVYVPRFPLAHNRTYRATFTAGGKTLRSEYTVPAPPKTAAPMVTKIYPTAKELPANNLKFYIYFSQPMAGGTEIFDQIYLVDEKGNKIDDSWLRDELWDASGKQLVIFIHPGRIKWGLLLRQLLGPVLHPGRRYTLVVSRKMRDRNDNELDKDYRVAFRTTAENRKRLELSQWKIQAPQASTQKPVQLSLPHSADHMSLKRFLTVVDDAGKRVAGRVEISNAERRWAFHPKQNWRNANYKIQVNDQFEDVAGNLPTRAFDLDLSQTPPPPQRLSLPFRPRQK